RALLHACLSLQCPVLHYSPPFPYTTLFRSGHGDRHRQSRVSVAAWARPRTTAGAHSSGRHRIRGSDRSGGRSRRCEGASGATTRDRKSTRLNSSHVSISYAVLCLKKKNKAR